MGGGVTAQERGERNHIFGLTEQSTRIGSGDAGNMRVVHGGPHARCVGEARRQGTCTVRTSWSPALLEDTPGRDVYLPPGLWIDYQDGQVYEGARWHNIHAGEVPIVLLARDGAAIPHAKLAQSTDWIDWGEMELVVFGAEAATARGLVCLPGDDDFHELRLMRQDAGFTLEQDPLNGRVEWSVSVRP